MTIYMKKQTIIFLLLSIFILACILRFTKLSEFPVGFHIDEASLGYNGYSLLKTGKEEHGIPMPLYVDMFGDNRPSGYHYLTVLPIALFGLNEFATRFPGALFGSLTVFAMYLLVYQIFITQETGYRKQKISESSHKTTNRKPVTNVSCFVFHVPEIIALLSSFLLALSPWHINLSRASAEAVVALFFILLGFGLLLKSFRIRKIPDLLFGILSMSFSYFFYHTPRVFVPLLLVTLTVFFYHQWRSFGKKYITALVLSVSAACILSFSLIFLINGGTDRFSQVNIFGFPETRLVLEEQIREDGTQMLPPKFTRVFHNKFTNYALTFATNYLEYFSGEFLFIKGGLPIWYKIPNVGLLYLVELPFIITGFVYLGSRKKLILAVPIIWMVIAPVTAAITTDDIPNINRSIVLFPMFQILAAVGCLYVIEHLPRFLRYAAIGVSVMALGCNSGYFLHQYFVHAKTHQTWYRFNGFKELVNKVQSQSSKYDKVFVTKSLGGIYPHFLFFMQYDPLAYQKEGSPKDRDYKGFGPYIFVPQACPSYEKDDKFPLAVHPLFVDNGTCKISTVYKTEGVFREDGTRAFTVVYPELLPVAATVSATTIIRY